MSPTVWPPPPPPPGDRAGRVWAPRLLTDLDEPSRSALSYVAVDEMFGGMVGLSVTPWPFADEHGRLRFDLAQTLVVGVSQQALQAYLAEHRIPEDDALRLRTLRVGDVFGARIDWNALRPVADQQQGHVTDQHAMAALAEAALGAITHPVYDLSDEAREYSKIAHLTTVAGTLSEEEFRELAGGGQ